MSEIALRNFFATTYSTGAMGETELPNCYLSYLIIKNDLNGPGPVGSQAAWGEACCQWGL